MTTLRELNAKETAEAEQIIKQYNEDPPFGIAHDRLEAWIKDLQTGQRRGWKLKEDAHTKRVRDIVLDADAVHKKALEKLNAKDAPIKDRYVVYEKASKTILEATLVDFDYDTLADDPGAGVGLLGQLAQEMFAFLVLSDGIAGHQRMRMRLNTEAIDRSNMLKMGLLNSKSSNSSQTDSAQSQSSTSSS